MFLVTKPPLGELNKHLTPRRLWEESLSPWLLCCIGIFSLSSIDCLCPRLPATQDPTNSRLTLSDRWRAVSSLIRLHLHMTLAQQPFNYIISMLRQFFNSSPFGHSHCMTIVCSNSRNCDLICNSSAIKSFFAKQTVRIVKRNIESIARFISRLDSLQMTFLGWYCDMHSFILSLLPACSPPTSRRLLSINWQSQI